jgi:V8-like Glu-specific endopeptidase
MLHWACRAGTDWEDKHMTKRGWIAAAVAVGAMTLTATTASAITSGELDGDGHPYVGLMVAKDEKGAPLWRCSGTLISPTLYLTAGHCTSAPAASATIWFESDLRGPLGTAAGYPFGGDTSVDGTTYTHPDYDDAAFFLADLGMVVLDEPVMMREYGQLPTEGQLSSLKPNRRTTFTAVGYGLQQAFPDAASWKTQADRVRMVAYPHLVQINRGIVGDDSMILSNNTNTGGTCFGDSGGPNFLGNSNVVAGVTSFGLNGACGGTGGVYRVDQADDLDWIYDEFGDQLN